MNKQHGNTGAVTVLSSVGLVLVGALGFIFYQKTIVQKAPVESAIKKEIPNSQLVSAKVFKSEDHSITFTYPNDWTAAEVVGEGNTDDFYGTSINVKSSKGKSVALLNSGGGFGGACEETEPFIKTTTIIKDSMSLKGIGEIAFGYTIVEIDDTNYGVAFGLVKNDIALGETSLQCPGLGVNYKYVVPESMDKAVGSLTFGLWYTSTRTDDDPNTYKFFTSFADVKAYTQSAEFKQIESMIKSLSIGA